MRAHQSSFASAAFACAAMMLLISGAPEPASAAAVVDIDGGAVDHLYATQEMQPAAAAVHDAETSDVHAERRQLNVVKIGICNGAAKTVNWHLNERFNSYGANRCRSDCDCDGQRYCGSFSADYNGGYYGICLGTDGRLPGQLPIG